MKIEKNRILRTFFLFLALFLIVACNFPGVGLKPGNVASPTKPPDLTPASGGNPPPTRPASAQTNPPTPSSAAKIVSIPKSVVEIDGHAYDAYQVPGDPFRFVCQQPCKADPNLIFAQYAGFNNARQVMLQLTGIEPLAEIQPVDFHLTNDSTCGTLATARALSFAVNVPPKHAYICTFLFEYVQASYTPDVAVQVDQQTIFVHEYLHLVFKGRIVNEAGAMHDFVTPLGLYIGHNLDSYENPCTYHPLSPPGDYGGYLLSNLCKQNGFSMEKLAPILIALDTLYQSGGGKVSEGYKHPSVTMGQFRDIINQQVGSDSKQAFADACWPANLFGDNYQLSYACLYPTPTVAPTPVK
jgi:hypothetical protein